MRSPTPRRSSRWASPSRCSPRSSLCTTPRSTLAGNTNLSPHRGWRQGEVHMFRLGALARAVVCAGLAILVLAPSAMALDDVNTKRLRDAVTVSRILGHARALQQIANLNGGTRTSGTPGFQASVDYVRGRLEAAGYTVTEQAFTFPFFRNLEDPTLSEVSPTPQDFETATFQ